MANRKIARTCRTCQKTFTVCQSQAARRPWDYCSRACRYSPTKRLGRLIRHTIPNASGCWLWQGVVNKQGYGKMKDRQLGTAFAHRIAYEVFIGPITDGLDVLHSCDTPACINPFHLSLGTHTDNMIDKCRKGRGGATTTLTPKQVRDIRADTRIASQVAPDYGVAPSTIQGIRRRESWKWIK